jgi:hypothetical protein
MRVILLALLMLPLGACNQRQPPAEVYRSAWHRMVVTLHLEPIFGSPCFVKEKTQFGDTYAFIGEDKCYRLNPPERIDGIWHYEFEGSQLLTSAEFAKGDLWSHDHTWLEPSMHLPDGLCDKDGPCDGDFHVVFIGRRSQYPGRYGHLGGSRNLVLMDRLISIERMPAAKTTESAAPR